MGIPNADTYVFVYAENVSSCATSGSSVVAYASSCQRDQYDRPTFGVINLCPQVLADHIILLLESHF
jgi:leishmanolysin-like peptidase